MAKSLVSCFFDSRCRVTAERAGHCNCRAAVSTASVGSIPEQKLQRVVWLRRLSEFPNRHRVSSIWVITAIDRSSVAMTDPEDRAGGTKWVWGCAPAKVQGQSPRWGLGAKTPRSWSISAFCVGPSGKSLFVNTKMWKLAHNVQPYES